MMVALVAILIIAGFYGLMFVSAKIGSELTVGVLVLAIVIIAFRSRNDKHGGEPPEPKGDFHF